VLVKPDVAVVHTHGAQLVVEATQEAHVAVHVVHAAAEVRVLVEPGAKAATATAVATALVAAAVVAVPDADTGHLVVANCAADVVVVVATTIVTITASTVVRVLVKSHVAVVHTHGAQLVVETTQEADVVVHIVHATAEVRVLVEAGTKSATAAAVAATSTVMPDSDTGHLVVANRAADEVVVVIATTIRVTASMVFPVLVKSDAAIVHTHGAQFVVEPAQEPDIPVHTILTAAEVRVLVEDCTETATRGFGFVCIEEVI
jgi:hypothetical protein